MAAGRVVIEDDTVAPGAVAVNADASRWVVATRSGGEVKEVKEVKEV